MNFSEDMLAKSAVHAIGNREEIASSVICGCFYCRSVFSPMAIQRWLSGEETALCAECGIDSVLGDASGLPVTDAEFLNAMHMRWFEEKSVVPSGVEEPEAVFNHEGEKPMSPHDPRAEALARARGMPDDLIAMIKEGLEDSRAGRVVSSSELFGRLAKKYGR